MTEYLEFFQNGKKTNFLEFPETEIGKESTIKLKIKNPNDWPLMIVYPLVNDKDITFSKVPDVIDNLGSVEIDVTLKPTQGRGPVKAELKIKVMF